MIPSPCIAHSKRLPTRSAHSLRPLVHNSHSFAHTSRSIGPLGSSGATRSPPRSPPRCSPILLVRRALLSSLTLPSPRARSAATSLPRLRRGVVKPKRVVPGAPCSAAVLRVPKIRVCKHVRHECPRGVVDARIDLRRREGVVDKPVALAVVVQLLLVDRRRIDVTFVREQHHRQRLRTHRHP